MKKFKFIKFINRSKEKKKFSIIFFFKKLFYSFFLFFFDYKVLKRLVNKLQNKIDYYEFIRYKIWRKFSYNNPALFRTINSSINIKMNAWGFNTSFSKRSFYQDSRNKNELVQGNPMFAKDSYINYYMISSYDISMYKSEFIYLREYYSPFISNYYSYSWFAGIYKDMPIRFFLNYGWGKRKRKERDLDIFSPGIDMAHNFQVKNESLIFAFFFLLFVCLFYYFVFVIDFFFLCFFFLIFIFKKVIGFIFKKVIGFFGFIIIYFFNVIKIFFHIIFLVFKDIIIIFKYDIEYFILNYSLRYKMFGHIVYFVLNIPNFFTKRHFTTIFSIKFSIFKKKISKILVDFYYKIKYIKYKIEVNYFEDVFIYSGIRRVNCFDIGKFRFFSFIYNVIIKIILFVFTFDILIYNFYIRRFKGEKIYLNRINVNVIGFNRFKSFFIFFFFISIVFGSLYYIYITNVWTGPIQSFLYRLHILDYTGTRYDKVLFIYIWAMGVLSLVFGLMYMFPKTRKILEIKLWDVDYPEGYEGEWLYYQLSDDYYEKVKAGEKVNKGKLFYFLERFFGGFMGKKYDWMYDQTVRSFVEPQPFLEPIDNTEIKRNSKIRRKFIKNEIKREIIKEPNIDTFNLEFKPWFNKMNEYNYLMKDNYNYVKDNENVQRAAVNKDITFENKKEIVENIVDTYEQVSIDRDDDYVTVNTKVSRPFMIISQELFDINNSLLDSYIDFFLNNNHFNDNNFRVNSIQDLFNIKVNFKKTNFINNEESIDTIVSEFSSLEENDYLLFIKILETKAGVSFGTINLDFSKFFRDTFLWKLFSIRTITRKTLNNCNFRFINHNSDIVSSDSMLDYEKLSGRIAFDIIPDRRTDKVHMYSDIINIKSNVEGIQIPFDFLRIKVNSEQFDIDNHFVYVLDNWKAISDFRVSYIDFVTFYGFNSNSNNFIYNYFDKNNYFSSFFNIFDSDLIWNDMGMIFGSGKREDYLKLSSFYQFYNDFKGFIKNYSNIFFNNSFITDYVYSNALPSWMFKTSYFFDSYKDSNINASNFYSSDSMQIFKYIQRVITKDFFFVNEILLDFYKPKNFSRFSSYLSNYYVSVSMKLAIKYIRYSRNNHISSSKFLFNYNIINTYSIGESAVRNMVFEENMVMNPYLYNACGLWDSNHPFEERKLTYDFIDIDFMSRDYINLLFENYYFETYLDFFDKDVYHYLINKSFYKKTSRMRQMLFYKNLENYHFFHSYNDDESFIYNFRDSFITSPKDLHNTWYRNHSRFITYSEHDLYYYNLSVRRYKSKKGSILNRFVWVKKSYFYGGFKNFIKFSINEYFRYNFIPKFIDNFYNPFIVKFINFLFNCITMFGKIFIRPSFVFPIIPLKPASKGAVWVLQKWTRLKKFYVFKPSKIHYKTFTNPNFNFSFKNFQKLLKTKNYAFVYDSESKFNKDIRLFFIPKYNFYDKYFFKLVQKRGFKVKDFDTLGKRYPIYPSWFIVHLCYVSIFVIVQLALALGDPETDPVRLYEALFYEDLPKIVEYLFDKIKQMFD